MQQKSCCGCVDAFSYGFGLLLAHFALYHQVPSVVSQTSKVIYVYLQCAGRVPDWSTCNIGGLASAAVVG